MTPTHYIPKAEDTNRINILQHTSGHFGVALAMREDYTPQDINKASSYLSHMIEEVTL